jgi:hypothetical protein
MEGGNPNINRIEKETMEPPPARVLTNPAKSPVKKSTVISYQLITMLLFF